MPKSLCQNKMSGEEFVLNVSEQQDDEEDVVAFYRHSLILAFEFWYISR